MNLSLEQLHTLSLSELAGVPAAVLVALQAEIDRVSEQTKSLKDKFEAVISQRYDNQVQALRQQQGKDTGVIRFEDDEIEVSADRPKRPQWDQAKLASIAEKVRVNGEDPLEFMTVTYKVPESKYKAWPEHLKSIFRDARTLNVGKQRFVLKFKEEK